jgi:glutathione S-transferase
MRLYDFLDSGNGYKVRLLLHKLDIAYERVEMDILSGATRTPEFLARNPDGRIPSLELDDGRILPESNAILCYLADGSRFIPEDRFDRAQVMRWMFWEQYVHEPNVAVARFIRHFTDTDSPRRGGELTAKMEGGNRALGIMDRHLKDHDFLVGDSVTIADISLYAYTHVAGEGGFELNNFPNLVDWLDRVADDAPHIRIDQG